MLQCYPPWGSFLYRNAVRRSLWQQISVGDFQTLISFFYCLGNLVQLFLETENGFLGGGVKESPVSVITEKTLE